jgi:DNA-binding transcriptional MerR regulator
MSEQPLTIGELARRTGVATSALRYWDGIGLLPAPVRVAGQRRYPPSSVDLVGEILLLRDAGYNLPEIATVIEERARAGDGWRALARRKLDELDRQIAKAQAARTAIAHSLACPHNLHGCPSYARMVAARLAGSSLEDAHVR